MKRLLRPTNLDTVEVNMSRFCQTHEQPLTLYTSRHARILCSDCQSDFPDEYSDSITITDVVVQFRLNEAFETLMPKVRRLNEVIHTIFENALRYQAEYDQLKRNIETQIKKKYVKMLKYKRYQRANIHTNLSEEKEKRLFELQSVADHYVETEQRLANLITKSNDLLQNVETFPHHNEDVFFYIVDFQKIFADINALSSEVYATEIRYNNTEKIASYSLGELHFDQGQSSVEDFVQLTNEIQMQNNRLFRRRFTNQPEIILFGDLFFSRITQHVGYSDNYVFFYDDSQHSIYEYRIRQGRLLRTDRGYDGGQSENDISVDDNGQILICVSDMIEILPNNSDDVIEYDIEHLFTGTFDAITLTENKVYSITLLSEAANPHDRRWKLVEIDPSNDELNTRDINLQVDVLDNRTIVQCMTSNRFRIYVIINSNLHCLSLTGRDHWTYRFLDHTYEPKSITVDNNGNIFALVHNTTTGENNVIKVDHDGGRSKVLFNDFEEIGMKNPVSLFLERTTCVLSICDEDRQFLVFRL